MVFEVSILGSNSASFAFGRHHTAQVLNHDQNLYLIDCGEGTQIQLLKYRIRPSRLNHIFISHLHGDHYLGLMGLISTLHLQGRTTPLTVFGPPGLDEIITLQLKYSDTRLNYDLSFVPVFHDKPGLIFQTENLEVEVIPMQHRIPCCGFLFRERNLKSRLIRDTLPEHITAEIAQTLRRGEDYYEEGKLVFRAAEHTWPAPQARSYAYCADTRYTEAIVDQIHGVDLLYHEATFESQMEQRAWETYHSTPRQAAMLARQGQVRRLLIGHFSSRYRQLNSLLAEARTVFENTWLAEEGHTFPIGSQVPQLLEVQPQVG